MHPSLPAATWDGGGRVNQFPAPSVASDRKLGRIRWSFVQPGCTNRVRMSQYFTTISVPVRQD